LLGSVGGPELLERGFGSLMEAIGKSDALVDGRSQVNKISVLRRRGNVLEAAGEIGNGGS
jgi:hypothetical protein